MFQIDIPEVATERTLDEILKHLAFIVSGCKGLEIEKHAKEAVDMVIAYINKQITYFEALTNIYSIGEGLGIKGITLGAIVVDLNEAKELIE